MYGVVRKCFLNAGLVKEARTPAILVTRSALLTKENTPTVGDEVDPVLGTVKDESPQ